MCINAGQLIESRCNLGMTRAKDLFSDRQCSPTKTLSLAEPGLGCIDERQVIEGGCIGGMIGAEAGLDVPLKLLGLCKRVGIFTCRVEILKWLRECTDLGLLGPSGRWRKAHHYQGDSNKRCDPALSVNIAE